MTGPKVKRYFRRPPAYGAETRGKTLVENHLQGGYAI